MKRNHYWILAVLVVLAGAIGWGLFGASASAKLVTVYKTPNCGCCTKWEEHLMANGFKVKTIKLDNLAELKEKHGVKRELASCHTALVDGYVVEGHVPAEAVKKLLAERPQLAGITVPGMPIGSPGMEQGDLVERYNVLSFDASGNSQIFMSY